MPREFQFEITESDRNKRLDRFLYDHIGAVSRMFLADLIRQNLAFVNGEPQPGGYKLKLTDKVSITFDDTAETAMTPEDLPLEIIFEDAEILVVNKPAGMLVHPTKRVKTGTLANALTFHLNQNNPDKIIRPGLIHRLDKETSGLMVTAKTARALRILSDHFQRKLIEKKYLAVVDGIVSQDEGRATAPIGRLAGEKPHWRVLPDGKEAETVWRVLERRSDNTTLLELTPITGRTNQLRIHCAHLGYPIVGDSWYGGREFSRLCLHAARLAFHHPNGGWLDFSAELPAQMRTQ
jgi:23S rRNA pseudouridine1911/1915/1917 synthase